jgi:hypothetical protein
VGKKVGKVNGDGVGERVKGEKGEGWRRRSASVNFMGLGLGLGLEGGRSDRRREGRGGEEEGVK